jgi:hypothetical protein
MSSPKYYEQRNLLTYLLSQCRKYEGEYECGKKSVLKIRRRIALHIETESDKECRYDTQYELAPQVDWCSPILLENS